jgi:Fe-S-cluster-containing dehydrogenase component/formate-dependent nitrite reductase membrane component NrfD
LPALAPAWAKVVDHTRCIGCHACTTACKSENQVPLGVTRTYVKYVDVGVFPNSRRAFQVTRCNMCADAPCVTACPTSAMYQRHDGIVDFDKSACIGCKACMAACPYDAIFINPEDHSAEKCNFCAHRLDVGLEPACVVVCPTEALFVGDMNDPESRVGRTVSRAPVAVRRPEKDTRPKLFYVGAHQATLDPLAAQRPPNGLYMWAEQPAGVGSGHPSAAEGDGRANSSAAAILAYDVAHRAPWDWRVSLYTWTKAIAAGTYRVAVVAALLGVLDWGSALVSWVAPLVALVFLALTGGVLIWDLEHPERFHYLFTRPQWGSWLVRGAVIILAYGAAVSAHLLGSVLGRPGWQQAAAVLGIPAAVMTAVYTAYLFARSKARDLWQSPLLPPHIALQAVLAGSATLVLAAVIWQPEAAQALGAVVAGATLLHLLFVWGEVTLAHPTAHARAAVAEMVRGRYSPWFWSALLLVAPGLAVPWASLLTVAPLVAVVLYEHAYIQAGQSVPLA